MRQRMKITVIPRVEKDGTPILFLPDDPASAAMRT
jgi:hypothetical protein